MKDRDCENCIHRKENGCTLWDCDFEHKNDFEPPKNLKPEDAITDVLIDGQSINEINIYYDAPPQNDIPYDSIEEALNKMEKLKEVYSEACEIQITSVGDQNLSISAIEDCIKIVKEITE